MDSEEVKKVSDLRFYVGVLIRLNDLEYELLHDADDCVLYMDLQEYIHRCKSLCFDSISDVISELV